jgi:hypothetical protein
MLMFGKNRPDIFIKEEKFDEIACLLEIISEKYVFKFNDSMTPEYVKYLESPQYREWKEKQEKK